jgi:flavin-dependent dehydrogenase
MSKFDVVVVGAGHNGLTHAAYPARAGLSVRLRKSRVIGVRIQADPGNAESEYAEQIHAQKVQNEAV